MIQIKATMLTAELETKYNDDIDDDVDYVVLKFGNAEVNRWRVYDAPYYAHDKTEYVEQFVAEKLRVLLGSSVGKDTGSL